MTDFFNIIEPALLSFLAAVITAAFSYFGLELKKLAARFVDTSEKKQIVTDVVHFVEQVYQDDHGPDKLQKALNQASMLLANRGIQVSQEELRTLIEAAVHGLKSNAGA